MLIALVEPDSRCGHRAKRRTLALAETSLADCRARSARSSQICAMLNHNALVRSLAASCAQRRQSEARFRNSSAVMTLSRQIFQSMQLKCFSAKWFLKTDANSSQ
jgi:hypothetical protein